LTISANEFFILGMVSAGSSTSEGISGTTINELIESRNIQEWTRLSFSSIYYLLNQLEKKNLIKGAIDKDKPIKGVGAPQKLFLLTQKGKRTLRKTLIEYLNRVDLNYTEFNIALSTAHILTIPELRKYMINLKERLDQRLRKVQHRYTDRDKELPPEEMPPQVWALFNHAFYMLNAKQSFLDAFIKKLEEY